MTPQSNEQEGTIPMKAERFYRQRTVCVNGVCSYRVTMTAADGSDVEVEVSRAVYKELLDLQREHWRLERRESRHTYHVEQMSKAQATCLLNPNKPLDAASNHYSLADIKKAVDGLSPEQRRRFLLYHLYGLSSVQIAVIEGCSDRAVRYSIAAARKNLQKSLGA
jgi:RNA polymerase sigma-70 factor (ECF subfamily)